MARFITLFVAVAAALGATSAAPSAAAEKRSITRTGRVSITHYVVVCRMKLTSDAGYLV